MIWQAWLVLGVVGVSCTLMLVALLREPVERDKWDDR